MPAKTTELVWAITQPQWPWRISEGNLIISERNDSSTDAIVSEARALARATIASVARRRQRDMRLCRSMCGKPPAFQHAHLINVTRLRLVLARHSLAKSSKESLPVRQSLTAHQAP